MTSRTTIAHSRRPRLVLFSGIGLDGGLFAPQFSLPADVITPTWIDPIDGETLAAYARRMAAEIDPGGPLFLGGVSMGGMVALEAARLLKPRGVFLIASCYAASQLAAPVRALGRGVGLLPPPLLAASLGLAPLAVRLTGRPNRRQRRHVLSLVPRANLRHIAWGGPAVMNWQFAGQPDFPVHQIHGADDRIIPIQNVRPDHTLPTGGHIISVTRAAEVNAFIAARLGL